MSAKETSRPQLHMIWPPARIVPVTALAHGYSVRLYRSGDEEPFLQLMSLIDFDPWDAAKLEYNINRALPGGWFFVTDPSEGIVASAMCLHNYCGREPFTGDVGWVACHPQHRGKGLGLSLVAHVTNRFLAAGYARIQLRTEHYRLPAIKTYLKVGYEPNATSSEGEALWQEAYAKLGLVWPHARV